MHSVKALDMVQQLAKVHLHHAIAVVTQIMKVESVLTSEKEITKKCFQKELEEAKPQDVPLDLCSLDNSDSELHEEKKLYQPVVGILNYVANCTRTEILFAVNFVAKKLAKPTKADLKRTKVFVLFVPGTNNCGIRL